MKCLLLQTGYSYNMAFDEFSFTSPSLHVFHGGVVQ